MITPFRRSNLARLAIGLQTIDPSKFNMEKYTNNEFGHYNARVQDGISSYHECGTTCCAAGHGPLFGITPLECETWDAYVNRCFTGGTCGILFSFLFSEYWPSDVTDVTDAIRRLAYVVLNQAVPPAFDRYNYTDSRVSCIPDSFTFTNEQLQAYILP